ncbi:MAG: hypothetical protein C5B57_07485 [Blastocatellia bacterium]|nr:MAG: hypothetical protein C5B57_07485 [Blastocatellia bacterium]
MQFARLIRPYLALALIFALGWPVAAQVNSVSSADIQRLQDNINDASRDVAQLRSRDATLASQLQSDLDDARDETIYLKVKLSKNETVTRSEYSGLCDRIDNLRNRARGESAGGYGPPAAASTSSDIPRDRSSSTASRTSSAVDVPAGTELDIRLQNSLSSKTAQVEDRFEATTVVDLKDGDHLLIPAGSVMRGMVSSVNKAGRIERKGSMTLAFDQLTIRGRAYPIRATVTQALESEGVRGEAGKIGAGAGVGAIIGGILGGVKGALAGILIGGGGVIAATEGNDVELPAGTMLRVRLDTGLDLH